VIRNEFHVPLQAAGGDDVVLLSSMGSTDTSDLSLGNLATALGSCCIHPRPDRGKGSLGEPSIFLSVAGTLQILSSFYACPDFSTLSGALWLPYQIVNERKRSLTGLGKPYNPETWLPTNLVTWRRNPLPGWSLKEGTLSLRTKERWAAV